jgi:H+/Cl- antiporter ClcA
MNPPSPSVSRSAGQWIVAIIFGLLTVGFLLRFLQYGYKWLSHAVEGDANFKVLAVWALIYTVVCGGIAAFACFLPRDEASGAPGQNGERGT